MTYLTVSSSCGKGEVVYPHNISWHCLLLKVSFLDLSLFKDF